MIGGKITMNYLPYVNRKFNRYYWNLYSAIPTTQQTGTNRGLILKEKCLKNILLKTVHANNQNTFHIFISVGGYKSLKAWRESRH
jgi:hypothetical protein